MNLSGDDKLNLVILAALMAWLAIVVPDRLAEHDDAVFGANVKARFR